MPKNIYQTAGIYFKKAKKNPHSQVLWNYFGSQNHHGNIDFKLVVITYSVFYYAGSDSTYLITASGQ